MATVAPILYFLFFFFNDTATTEIYTLSLHDALPIYRRVGRGKASLLRRGRQQGVRTSPAGHDVHLDAGRAAGCCDLRSEEHTSELQSQSNLVCRLLLEKKKETQQPAPDTNTHAVRSD